MVQNHGKLQILLGVCPASREQYERAMESLRVVALVKCLTHSARHLRCNHETEDGAHGEVRACIAKMHARWFISDDSGTVQQYGGGAEACCSGRRCFSPMLDQMATLSGEAAH